MQAKPDPLRRAQVAPVVAPLQAAAQRNDAFLDGYWVRFPAALRRYSVLLAEAWRDGVFLTAWPAMAKAAPAAALAIGLIEGVVRRGTLPGSPYSLGDNTAVVFTELLPFMLVVAAAGALSTNLGLLLTLGYAVGDFLTNTQPQMSMYGTGPLWTALTRVFMLTSYLELALLAVMPTLTTKLLTLRLPQALSRVGMDSVLIAGGATALLQGIQVYGWTLAAPVLMRVLWAGGYSSPPSAAAYYAQMDGGWIVAAAVTGVGARAWLSREAFRRPEVRRRVALLVPLLRAADAHPAVTRRLPPAVRALLAAAVMTLLLAGIIATAPVGLLVFAYLTAVLELRMAVLPGWAPWAAWTRLMGKIPILVRLIAAVIAVYFVTQLVVNATMNLPLYAENVSGSFQPMLIAVCVALLVMIIPFPTRRSSAALADTERAASRRLSGAQSATAMRKEAAR